MQNVKLPCRYKSPVLAPLAILAAVVICGSMLSCSLTSKPAKKFRIGFSQCTGDSNWRKATLNALQRELSFHPGTELIYRNAGDNSDLQVKQIREVAQSGIDILLVSPNETQPLTTAVEEVRLKSLLPMWVLTTTASGKWPRNIY
jgi:ABC-type sugar transport system substrate-binding protein